MDVNVAVAFVAAGWPKAPKVEEPPNAVADLMYAVETGWGVSVAGVVETRGNKGGEAGGESLSMALGRLG